MNEENKKIVLPISKIEVELKGWVTGRDIEYINTPVIDKFSFKPQTNKDKEIDFSEIEGSSLMEMKKRSIEKVVVSIGGSSENVVERALDLHSEDYQFILEAVDGVLKKK